ncbi:MAG: FtsX-like permease family protein, partial [Gammaproteobacteria bacterium]|nr:FtsX-like permease family protein [Gammaproteobacteria bacterium]
YAQADSLLGVQAGYWIRSQSGQGVSQQDYSELRRAGFRQVFPVVEGEVSTTEGDLIRVIATDLFALPAGASDFGDTQNQSDSASGWLELIQPPYRAWLPQQLADELNLVDGDRLELRDGRKLPPAVIQSREQQGRQVFMDIAAAFELLNRSHFSYLAVSSLKPDKLDELQQILPPDLKLVENQQHLNLAQLTESLHTHLTAMSLLSFAVGLFIVFNAVRFSLWYRRPTFMTLRLMGVSASQLTFSISLEVLIWSIVGTLLGVLTGLQIAYWLLPGLGASLQSLYDAVVETEIIWQFNTLLKAWLITLAGLVWALGLPLYQLLNRNSLPSDQIERTPLDEERSRLWLTAGSIVLIALAGITYPFVTNAQSGFILLGLLLFAAAWMLPALLALTLKFLSKYISNRSLFSRWLVSDSWLQLPTLRTAMMALMLAMTANLGVGTLVDSFRHAFINWLEIRQSADIYLRSTNLNLEQLTDPAQSAEWLANSHRRIGVNSQWRGRQTLIRGVDSEAPDSRQLPLAQWLGDSPEDTLALWRQQPDNILANEQAHYLGGLELGETIELQTDRGNKKYRVVGFFYDYGTPYYQFYLPRAEVNRLWIAPVSLGIALWLTSSDSPSHIKLAETAMRAAGATTGDWISQREIRKLSLNIFDRTFAITSAMNALTMLVAAIALLASLLAILQERLPQFAQWRAIGIRRREQMMIISCPIFIFVGVAWLLAVPLGALLSWILIHKLNIVSFGWSMPMLWELRPAWQLAAIILSVVAVSILLAGIQLRRQLPKALAQLGEMA